VTPSLSISAYVPCYNNEDTIVRAVEAIRRQTIPVQEVIVVDDGSTDGSAAAARSAGARVAHLGRNSGRGPANARGILEAHADLVVCCGATNVLEPDFVERALPWFDEPLVAAVYARVDDPRPEGVVRRWRARHLFRTGSQAVVEHHASLITTGSILRRTAVLKVGNFNTSMRQVEDAELGDRLIAAGYDIVSDPRLRVISVAQNTVSQVLERYWRWGVGIDESLSLTWYRKQIAYSVKVMVRQDLAEGDVLAVPLSLFSPHYQFWRTLGRKMKRRMRTTIAHQAS
jgi:glycosyltransferase involved in cell wall biosynthesis